MNYGPWSISLSTLGFSYFPDVGNSIDVRVTVEVLGVKQQMEVCLRTFAEVSKELQISASSRDRKSLALRARCQHPLLL